MSFPSAPAPAGTLQHAQTPQLPLLLADYRSSIVGATVVGHLAHWRYLTGFRRLNPSAPSHRNRFLLYGAAWGCVYIGVLSGLTIAERKAAAAGRIK